MNKEPTHTNSAQNAGEASDLVAELIRNAGPRQNPSAQQYDDAFAAARSALTKKRRDIRMHRYRVVGLAASLCLALVGSLYWLTPVYAPLSLNNVVRIVGMAEWRAGGTEPWSVIDTPGAALAGGSELRTMQGAALSLAFGNRSLRLAGDTAVILQSSDEIYLVEGKVYLDSPDDSGPPVSIITPAAIATEIGTQFEVLYTTATYRLRVREGSVLLAADGGELNGGSGDEVMIDADGTIQRGYLASDDPDWAWVMRLAPAPAIDGEPLSLLLKWIERETGREIIYADPVLELKARQTIMHGTIDNLTPMQALEVVLATTDLDADATDDGRILIYAAKTSD